ncbi:MAG TPA: DDE-type integrase/transposase/recombinase [Acetobacteraceae bacterium]|nr:DDE-type integrase/transposase/recombinase [Acetobacteraceae bacterium]
MNKLSPAKRADILGMMAEGVSLRAIARLTGASKNTIAKLLEDAGEAFSEYQDKAFRNLTCKRLQVDEIWSFVHCKQRNVATAKAAPAQAGDLWTWTAIDADTKLIPSWLVSSRDGDAAKVFISDLAGRLANRVQLTTDGHRPYLEAVEEAFGADIDYAMLIKIYGEGPTSPGRYSPGVCVGAETRRIEGRPDADHISTSYAERANLSMRMGIRRFTRLTNGFSKKAENHAHGVAIYFMHYNFVKIHGSLRCTPAMAAGVTTKLWEMADMVKVLEAWEARQGGSAS